MIEPKRLLVCTPSSSPRSSWSEGFLRSLNQATHGGLVRIFGASNIALARNEVSALAYARSLADRRRDLWLWVDDDEWSSVDSALDFVDRALCCFGDSLPMTIVSGTYARKDGSRTIAAGVTCVEEDDYYRASWLPGGALLHSIGTFERMTEVCESSLYGDVPGWRVWQNCIETDDCGVDREAGEDVGFCRIAQSVGASLWLDTAWVLSHEDRNGIIHLPDFSVSHQRAHSMGRRS
jgi:hypothetical protein